MARKGTMFARAARRAALALKRLPATRGRSATHLGDLAFTCPYCSITVKTRSGRDRHVELNRYCRARRLRELGGYVSAHLKKKRRREARTRTETPAPTRPKRPRSDSVAEDESARPQKRPRADIQMPECGPTPVQLPILEPANSPPRADKARNNAKRSTGGGTPRGSCFVEEFPIPTAGAPVSDERKPHELSKGDLHDYLVSCGKMGEPAKFEVAELLMTTGLKAKDRTKYLRSVLCRGRGYWRNNRKLVQEIDRLPSGPKWTTETITVGEGDYKTQHIVFKRDIIEVIKDLMSDPRFKQFMRYAPERHWTSHERECRVYGEMWSGNWWWRMQAKNLRHFKKGITSVQQWTGRETKEMVKQYLPIIANDPNVPDAFVKMVRVLLDFLYLAERAQLTASELEEMEEALRTFHSLKKVLVELELVADLDKFDYVPKFHMLGHYAHSIRELGTPDGYNTESPEHLHVIYVKRGWRASNHRQAIKQIVDYIRRLDAIRIQHAYIVEYFGEHALGGDSDKDNNDNGDNNDSDDEDEEGGDDDEEGQERVEVETAEEKSDPAYPRPTLSVAVRPTRPRLTGHDLIGTYGATDLIRSLTRFLKPLARRAGLKPIVLPSDMFDTWHKISLGHESPSFAPNEPPHRDVIRIQPPSRDQHGRRLPGLFDTALFLHQPQAVGLYRESFFPFYLLASVPDSPCPPRSCLPVAVLYLGANWLFWLKVIALAVFAPSSRSLLACAQSILGILSTSNCLHLSRIPSPLCTRCTVSPTTYVKVSVAGW
ncbi:hypothetical protein FRC10_001170 [Ceratobasidium sp. 414]|nr:hypothetical protein FRC10_001170 [Ceratobasidium sp. 414]